MTKLELYLASKKDTHASFMDCLRESNGWKIGPTNKGNLFLRCYDKEVRNTLTPNDLKNLRDLINTYLTDVLGETNDIS